MRKGRLLGVLWGLNGVFEVRSGYLLVFMVHVVRMGGWYEIDISAKVEKVSTQSNSRSCSIPDVINTRERWMEESASQQGIRIIARY